MSDTQLADSKPLLTYALQTNPSPVQVSPPSGTTMFVSLTIVISVPRTLSEVTLTRIVFQLPIGDGEPDATDLSETTGFTASITDPVLDPQCWQIGPGPERGWFILEPAPGASCVLGERGIVVLIVGIQLSPQVGTATIQIAENAASDDYPAEFRYGALTVEKFPNRLDVSDFKAITSEIKAGDTATLTWSGTSDADYSLSYPDGKVAVRSVRRWTSPPLWRDTNFTLTATAIVDGETVVIQLQTYVTVASPKLDAFFATPDHVDDGQSVTLTWRAFDADGVYLVTDEQTQEELPAVSDPNHPKTIVPRYRVVYTLQAYKLVGDVKVLSLSSSLALVFNPLVIERFTANPATIGLDNLTTTLVWKVKNAARVTYQGQTVDAEGSQSESPTEDSSYALEATSVDGTTVTRETVNVAVQRVQVEDGWTATFHKPEAGYLNVVLDFRVQFASAGTVSEAVLQSWLQRNPLPGSGPLKVNGVQLGADHWQFTLPFDTWYGFDKADQFKVTFDYHFEGYLPVSKSGLSATTTSLSEPASP